LTVETYFVFIGYNSLLTATCSRYPEATTAREEWKLDGFQKSVISGVMLVAHVAHPVFEQAVGLANRARNIANATYTRF